MLDLIPIIDTHTKGEEEYINITNSKEEGEIKENVTVSHGSSFGLDLIATYSSSTLKGSHQEGVVSNIHLQKSTKGYTQIVEYPTTQSEVKKAPTPHKGSSSQNSSSKHSSQSVHEDGKG